MITIQGINMLGWRNVS